MRVVTLVYLGILGIKDGKDREIPVWWLVVGLVLFAFFGIWKCINGETRWLHMLMGTLPGVLLLVLGTMSGKAGAADGILLAELGLYLGYQDCMLLFCCSVLLMAICSMVLLFCKKVHKNTRMPYFPFLAVVYWLLQ